MGVCDACCSLFCVFLFLIALITGSIWLLDPTHPVSISMTFVRSSYCYTDADLSEKQIHLGTLFDKHYFNGDVVDVEDRKIGGVSLYEIFDKTKHTAAGSKGVRAGLCSFQQRFSAVHSKCPNDVKTTVIDPANAILLKFSPIKDGAKGCVDKTECKFTISADGKSHDITVSADASTATSASATVCSKRL